MEEQEKSSLDRTIDRRQFIKGAAGILGGIALSQFPSSQAEASPSQLPNSKELAGNIELRELANLKGIELGALYVPEMMANPLYDRTFKSNFNSLSVSRVLHWGVGGTEADREWDLRPSRNEYNFEKADSLIEYADKNDLKTQGQHLVWGYNDENVTRIPSWLPESVNNGEDPMQIMEEHIDTVVKHYAKKMRVWSVVNEPLNNDGGYKSEDFWVNNCEWSNGIDPDYIGRAFKAARKAGDEADTKPILILNDYNNETINARSDALYGLVRRLKDEDVPINGIGMQMHLNALNVQNFGGPEAYAQSVKANMERFKNDLRMRIYITEFDVNLADLDPNMSREEKFAYQADIYKHIIKAATETGLCKNINLWAHTDAQAAHGPNGDSGILNVGFQPKPAYEAIKEELINLPDSTE